MAAMTNATPLIALDAVVLDTETTGLDPRQSRIVEIAAVRLSGGKLDAERFHSRVRPDVAIPKSATAIHGIDAAAVAGAPDFAEVWPSFADLVRGGIIVGHAIGFDIALLRCECERIGAKFPQARFLDTRLLAQVVAPDLADHGLESLSSWLGVEMKDRHSALGDALTTARVFCALVPCLRERGIRTVGEAIAACRALTDAMEREHRAGWAELEGQYGAEAEPLARIDTFAYRHRVHDVMRAPAQFIGADRNVRDALERMISERVSSVFVRPSERDATALSATETGIVTERDILRGLAGHGAEMLDMPASRFMTKPLMAVAADAFVYRAIARMDRLKIRHLGVVDEEGRVIGALSARDLLRLRASDAISLGDAIEQSGDVHALGAAWAKLAHVAASLRMEAVPAREIAAVISHELGALTRQAAILAEARQRQDGCGEAPCGYAVAVLGSAGRGESLLAMDQDNAIVFAEGEPDGANDRWFGALGAHIADILHEAGVPYCPGGVMAKNAQWRGSVQTWNERVERWIRRAQPQDLLSVDIFFDMRPVHGDVMLCETLWRSGFDLAKGDVAFVKSLAEAAGEFEEGLGWFGRFNTQDGRIDLKRCGLFGIVTAARLLAIRCHVVARATHARLAGLRALSIGAGSDLEALDSAQAVFLDLILAQQVHDMGQGRAPSNKVSVKSLGTRERERLRQALDAVRPLNELTRDILFAEN